MFVRLQVEPVLDLPQTMSSQEAGASHLQTPNIANSASVWPSRSIAKAMHPVMPSFGSVSVPSRSKQTPVHGAGIRYSAAAFVPALARK